MNSLLICIHSN